TCEPWGAMQARRAARRACRSGDLGVAVTSHWSRVFMSPSECQQPERHHVNRLKWAIPLAAVAIVRGYSPMDDWDVKRLAIPQVASARAHEVWRVWLGAWIAGLVVLLLVLGLILWSMFRYRKRDGNEVPSQVRYNLPIEALYTIAPI